MNLEPIKHGHYFKPVIGLTHIDVYRVLELFNVTDPCVQHAVKKLLRAGEGHKSKRQDVEEVIAALRRWLEMMDEDAV